MDRYDYIGALVDAHSTGKGKWRHYFALAAIVNYLHELAEGDEIEEDADDVIEAVTEIIEQCMANAEEPMVTVIHFNVGDVAEGEATIKTPNPLTEDEINKFTELLNGAPTAEKEADTDDND